MKVSKGTEIAVKRLYLHGVFFEECCEACGCTINIDLGENYLSYPVVGMGEEVYYCCGSCGEDGSMFVEVNISVKKVK